MSFSDFSDAVDRDTAAALVAEGRKRRPVSLYSPELATHVLSRIAKGETLTSICQDLGFTVATWSSWLDARPDLKEAHEYARVLGADAIADDIINIIDSVPADAMQIAKARLRTDMRLRLLAKWQPARYGDNARLEHTGPNGTPVQVAYANVSELAKQMRAVLAGKEKPEALLEHAPDEDSDIL